MEWLNKHPQFKGLSKFEIMLQMKADGLIAPTTYLLDCKFEDEFRVAGFIFSEGEGKK